MEVKRSQVVPFPRTEVWERLMDFDVIARSLPGIESLEPLDAETSRITMKVLIPAVTGSYEGTVKVVERNPLFADSLELVNEDFYGRGWMVVVEVCDPEQLNGLMDASAYRTFTESQTPE